MSDTIKTEHSARIRLVHGEDCEGCQNLAVEKAAHIVSLAGWRIVRTDPYARGEIAVAARDDEVVEITEEWKP